MKLDLSAEPISHQIKRSIRGNKRYCAVTFKSGQTYTPNINPKSSNIIALCNYNSITLLSQTKSHVTLYEGRKVPVATLTDEI